MQADVEGKLSSRIPRKAPFYLLCVKLRTRTRRKNTRGKKLARKLNKKKYACTR